MKKTLTLLALIAALMPMMPLTAKADLKVVTVKGVTIDTNDLSKSTGIFDAEKGWDTYDDGLLCWAATCSNLITWWETQNSATISKGTPTQNAQIWDIYRHTFRNYGGDIGQGLEWWLDGNYGLGTGKELYQRTKLTENCTYYLSREDGGFYHDSLWQGKVGNLDIQTLIPGQYDATQSFSMALVNAINQGYGVGLSWVYPSIFDNQAPMGHAVTVWGAEYDTETNLLTALYLTDSDNAHKEVGLVRVAIEDNGKGTFIDSNRRDHSIENFTLLNSSLSSDLNYFNYQDKDNNIVMKQKLNGEGFTITSETQEVNDIIYDGSRGEQAPERLLSVKADHSAKTVQVNATYGLNLLEVQQEVTLTVENVAGSGLLTKTGEGTLKLTDKDGGGKIAVQDGVLECGNGTLAEVTVNGGELQGGGGKFNKVTVNGGTLAVGNAPDYQQYSGGGVLTLKQAALEFHIAGFSKEASKWNGSGWGSGTYSNLDMDGGQIYLMEDDRIDEINFYLGGSALEALLQDGSFTLGLITGIKNSYFKPDYADLVANTHFYVSDDAEAIAGTTWLGGEDLTNHFTVEYEYVQSYDWGPYQVNMVGTYTGVTPPAVPEPTTSTLSLLALASLCARRRRK